MSTIKQWFLAGDIYGETTGGTLCDRLILGALQTKTPVELLDPRISCWRFPSKPGLGGLLANLRNLFRVFPRSSVLWIDNGCYRDIFLAVWVWRFFYQIRIVNIVYHLDSNIGKGWRFSFRTVAERILIKASDHLITISSSTLKQVVSLGLPQSICSMIPVSRRFDPRKIMPPDRSLWLKPEVTFLFVGTIEPRKGILDALKVLKNYNGKTQLRFRCAGGFKTEDLYFKELQKFLNQHPNIHVDFLGKISHDELMNEFLNADAFLFPSHWEGYGIAIEEAMCFGLPVIAYARGSIPELFSDDVREGWLIPFQDDDAFSKALDECVNDSALRLQRGRAAYRRSLDLVTPFDWNACLDEIFIQVGIER